MTAISPSTLAELVIARPARTRLFEQLRLDYCCGGSRTLGRGCLAPSASSIPATVRDADSRRSYAEPGAVAGTPTPMTSTRASVAAISATTSSSAHHGASAPASCR